MKKVMLFICSLVCWQGLYAQNQSDALIFSQYYSGGTARAVSMGGAFGALGGDLSTLSYNPAGLGVYRGTEFSFTPSLFFNKTKSEYDGNEGTDNQYKFILNNIGYVYTWELNQDKALKSINLGLAYNRISDFYSEAYVYSNKGKSSLLDEFVWNANGGTSGVPLHPDDLFQGGYEFYEGLAWDTYGIDTAMYAPSSWEYYRDDSDGNISQQRRILQTGGIGEYAVSVGANLNHKLYFGATMGIHDVNYKNSYYHEESLRSDYLKDFGFSDVYELNGWGINFKTGVIYRPIDILRLGFAMHTPTYYSLTEYWETSMYTDFNISPDGKEDYFPSSCAQDPGSMHFVSPWRLMWGAAYQLNQLALFDVDVEWLNYSKGEFSPDFEEKNNAISETFDNAVNIKLGTEFRFGPISTRLGYAYYGSAYKADSFTDNYTQSFSGGLGYKGDAFYIDMAYSYTYFPSYYQTLYQYDNYWAEVKLKPNANKILLTVGFKF